MSSDLPLAHQPYRPEIDGLRAIAVVPVILFHCGVGFFSRGFVGVDIFFVISGYLISLKLLEDLSLSKLSLLGFYQNRAKRILPALNAMLLLTAIGAWALMPPDEISAFGESLLYTSAFVANHYFSNATDYFAPSSDALPLLHTWSLAVEEQFYFIFPLLLITLWRYCKDKLFIVLILFFFTSYAVHLIGAKNFPASSYFFLGTRAWELLAGAFLAWHTAFAGSAKTPSEIKTVLLYLGVALVSLSILGWPGDALPAPYLWSTFPVLGTVLLIGLMSSRDTVGKLLGTRPFVYVGRISFSLYLWHFPVFALAKIHEQTTHQHVPLALLLIALTIVSILSFHWIENPIRYIKNPKKQLWVGMLAIQLGLLGLGFAMHSHTALFKTYTPEQEHIRSLFQFPPPTTPSWQTCEQATIDKPCVGGDLTAKEKIVLIGDSHAFTLFDAFSREAQQAHVQLVLYTKGNCPPLWPEIATAASDKCLAANQKIFDLVSQDPMVKAWVLSARWAWYFEGTGFDNLQHGQVGKNATFLKHLPTDSRLRRTTLQTYLNQTIEKLGNHTQHLYVINSIPEPGWHVAKQSIDIVTTHADVSKVMRYPQHIFTARNQAVDHALGPFLSKGAIQLIEPSQAICNSSSNAYCQTWQDEVPLYTDDNHLSPAGAKLVADLFSESWRKH